MQTRPAPATRALIGACLAALLAAIAYRDLLSIDFTGGDTLALIEVSRIRSFDEFLNVLTQPMLPIITKFYRPTANFSYAVDHRIWGLDATGFHISDIAIHAVVSALIVLLVQRWSKHSLAAFLAGATFALHPVLMETVPNPTRRQDMLGGLFMLLALLALPNFEERKPPARSWIVSLGCAALAMGAKEGSVVLPALVFAWALVVRPASARDSTDGKAALRVAAPFLAIAVVFVAIRALVLGGAGGNEYSWRWTLASIPAMGANTAEFLDDLVYPLRVVFHPYLSPADRALAVAAAVGFGCLLPSLLRRWPGTSVASKLLLRIALFACMSVLLVPAVSLWIRGAIEHSYGERAQPAEFYVWKVFDLARVAATGVLALAAGLVATLWVRARPEGQRVDTSPRWILFTLAWMGLHLALFLAVQRYHAWNAYVPTIPFCCFLGLVLARIPASKGFVAALVGGLMLWLAAFSPLVRGLESWKANGRFNALLMAEIARVAFEVPAGSTLEFRELPNLNFSWHTHGPEPTSAYTINQASTVSWVKLVQPGKALRVEVPTQKPVRGAVESIRMDWENSTPEHIVVHSKVALRPSD